MPRPQRHQTILRLLEAGPVASQEALAAALAEEGVSVTQATLSRDLRALGAVKGAEGYMLPGLAAVPAGDAEVRTAVRTWLTRAQVALNQVVLHTPAGGAQALALVLDRVQPGGLLGTIAGDDTILCVLPHERGAKAFKRYLEEVAS
jgi:transcriptional regulator of arginine metabolism